jgi:hypothetical protein
MGMEHFPDTFTLAYQKKLYQSEKKKKEQYAFLRSLAKVDNLSIQYILDAHQDKVSGKSLNKNALEYASENKDLMALKQVFDFFQNKKWDINLESVSKKNLSLNISEINFNENRGEQFLLAQHYQVPFRLNRLDYDEDKIVPFLTRFFSRKKIDNSDVHRLSQSVMVATNLLNANFELHFFEMAFWTNKQNISNLILKMNFSEKDMWIDSLFEQIELVCQSSDLLLPIIEKIELYFLHYPKILFSVIPMLTRLLQNNLFSAQLQQQLAQKSIDIIERLLAVNFKKTHDNKFHQFMLLWKNDYVIFDWNQFYSVLNHNFHSLNKKDYFSIFNKIILSYKLEQELPESDEDDFVVHKL